MWKCFRLAAAVLGASVAAGAYAPLVMLIGTDTRGAHNQLWMIGSIGFLAALIHAIVLGLPVYFSLKKFKLVNWWAMAFAGFLSETPL